MPLECLEHLRPEEADRSPRFGDGDVAEDPQAGGWLVMSTGPGLERPVVEDQVDQPLGNQR